MEQLDTSIAVAVQSLSHVWLFATPQTAACQASLSITNSHSALRLMSIESVMPSNHLILCCPLLLLPSIFPIIRVFSNESVLHIRWPKYWTFSFNICPSNEYSRLISFRIDWLDILEVQGTLKSFLQYHNLKASNYYKQKQYDYIIILKKICTLIIKWQSFISMKNNLGFLERFSESTLL